MVQQEVFQTIRQLCEAALFFYSIHEVGEAHRLLAMCEEILVENGYMQESALTLDVPGGGLLN